MPLECSQAIRRYTEDMEETMLVRMGDEARAFAALSTGV